MEQDFLFYGVGLLLIGVGIFQLVRGKASAGGVNEVEGFGLKVNVGNPSLLLIVAGIGVLVVPRIFPGGEEADPTDTRLADRLKQAEWHLARGDFTAPPDNNAWETYKAILAEHPGNGEAGRGVQKIAAHFVESAQNAIRAGDADQARDAYREVEKVLPGSAAAKQLARQVAGGYLAQATAALDAMRLEQAEQALYKAAVLDPELAGLSEGRKRLAALRIPPVGAPFCDDLVGGGCGPMVIPIQRVGRFYMGSSPETDGDERSPEDERRHEVTVEHPFALGEAEVTNKEYRRFQPDHDSGTYKGYPLDGDDQPVLEVSWLDAVAYTRWLSEQTGKSYRLPTEAEWEYAVRAGTHTRRYWGDDPADACGFANVYDKASDAKLKRGIPFHDCNDAYVMTAPVRTFKPNRFGLHDMLGNVWEWTCSGYFPTYNGLETQCAGDGGGMTRAVRGGSWGDSPNNIRSAYRYPRNKGSRFNFIGFRVARELDN